MDQPAIPVGYVRYGDAYPAELRYLVAPAPLPPRRHTRLYVLLAILGVLVVVALAVDVPFVRPIIQQYPATLHTPDSVVGLPRLTNSQFQAFSDRLRTAAAGATDSMVAFYGPVDNPGLGVLVAAATGFDLEPGRLSGTAKRLGLRGVTSVNPGSMGGYVLCGELPSAGALCAWSDYGSSGAVLALNRSADDTAALLRTIRPLIVKR